MANVQPLVSDVRRVAASLSSNLVRHHIEHIDFEKFLLELDTILAQFDHESSFERVLDHECFVEQLRAAVSERINNLKQLTGTLGTMSGKGSQDNSPTRIPDENLRSNLKRQILNLDALDCRLCEIIGKVDELRRKHQCSSPLKSYPSPNSLSELWKQLNALQSTLPSPCHSQTSSPKRKTSHNSQASYLLSLCSHYSKWQQALRKCVFSISQTIRKLIAMQPRQQQLFSKSQVPQDSHSQRKSALTQLIKHKTMETDTEFTRQVSTPDSDFELERAPENRRKQKKARKSPSYCAKQCAIF